MMSRILVEVAYFVISWTCQTMGVHDVRVCPLPLCSREAPTLSMTTIATSARHQDAVSVGLCPVPCAL